MPDLERYSSPEAEVTMLKSDLRDIFQTNSDTVAFHQPADWEQPAEVVLGGQTSFFDGREVYVHIRQRLDQTGANYLIITYHEGTSDWRQVNDINATHIYDGSEAPLSSDDAALLRYLIRPERVAWNMEYSESLAACENLYEKGREYAKRKQTE